MARIVSAALLLALSAENAQAVRTGAEDALAVEEALDPWKKAYCIQHSINEQDCDAAVSRMEQRCAALKGIIGGPAQDSSIERNKAKLEYASECVKGFFKDKADSEDSVKPRSHKIRDAAKVCEPKAKEVCIKTTCPTFRELVGDPDLDCETVCTSTFLEMFKTGSIECAEDQSWADCVGDLHASLKEMGRHAALEAISREHVLKCICASAKEDDSVCYQGGLGIPEGKRWCDFCDTPSFRTLFEKAGKEKCDWSAHPPSCARSELQ